MANWEETSTQANIKIPNIQINKQKQLVKSVDFILFKKILCLQFYNLILELIFIRKFNVIYLSTNLYIMYT